MRRMTFHKTDDGYVYVVLVFDPESGEFERLAGVYTTGRQALDVADAKWYMVVPIQLDAPECFSNLSAIPIPTESPGAPTVC